MIKQSTTGSKNRPLIAIGAGALAVALAGATEAVRPPQDSKPRITDTKDGIAGQPHFVTCGALGDAAVVGIDGEKLASADDLVIDTRSGRVAYVVLSRGGVVGVGATAIAAPYELFTWDAANEQFRTKLTGQQLERAPEFEADRLVQLSDPAWQSSTRGVFGWEPSPDSSYLREDPGIEAFRNGRVQEIEGTITDVKYVTGQGLRRDVVCLTIEDGDESRVVLLGPVSMLTARGMVPEVGTEVKVASVATSDDKKAVHIARTIAWGDEREIELRDQQGKPAWQNEDEEHGRPVADATRYALASQIMDGSLIAVNEETAGDVDHLVVDAGSGQCAFVTVSSGGFIGIGDTLYVMPFEVASLDREMNLHVDRMPNELERTCPELPDQGVAALNNGSFRERVYAAFNIKPRRFDARSDGTPGGDAADVAAIFLAGENVAFSGRILVVGSRTPIPGADTFTILTVQNADGKQCEVWVAPPSYLEAEGIEIRRGAEIEVRGREASMSRGKVVVASEIVTGGKRYELRSADGRAEWDDD